MQNEIEAIRREKEEERKAREQDNLKKDQISRDLNQARMNIESLMRQLQDQQQAHVSTVHSLDQELEDLKSQLAQKSSDLDMYQKRDESTEQALEFQIQQEQQYQALVKQHQTLETEWKGMEKYIRSLNDYQQHLEDKYGLMLEKF